MTADQSPASPDWWLEEGERMLWWGRPSVNPSFRLRALVRSFGVVAVYVAFAAFVLDDSLLSVIVVSSVIAVLLGSFLVVGLPRCLGQLSRTTYAVTNRRGVVEVRTPGGVAKMSWVPLTGRINVIKGHDGRVDIDLGRVAGTAGSQGSAANRVAQALGFLDKPKAEKVRFVGIRHPEALLSAIKSVRTSYGVSPEF